MTKTQAQSWWTVALVTLFVAAAGTWAVSQYVSANTAEKHNYVFSVCNQARMSLDGLAEQKCGNVQDDTETEFLCERNDMDPSTQCWVEAR